MKKNLTFPFLTVLFALLLGVSSCTKDDLVVPYNLGDQSFCVEVNPFQATTEHTFSITQAQVNAVLSAAGVTDIGKVKKAALKTGFKASIATGGTALNFDEFEGMQVFMKETGTSGDGSQIAYTNTLGAGATETEFLLNGTDLILALKKDVTFTVKITNKPAGNSNKACVLLSKGTIELSVKQ